MNLRKDILLISLGILLFAAGVAVYLNPGLIAPPVPDEEGRAAILDKLRLAAPAGEAYPGTPRASLEDNVKDWLSPEEDEDNWDYDLFTAIDVVWDPSIKEYVPRSRKAEVLPPFGVALVSVGYPTYTYMLSSSSLPPGKKEEDRLFSLKNVKTNRYLDDCKLNRPIPEAPYLTLKAYRVEKGKDADGFPFVRNILTVDDRQFGQVVDIDDERPLEFKKRIDIILRSTDDPSWSQNLHQVGDKFELNGASFVVKGIDLAGKSVTFEKTIVLNPKRPKKLTFDQQTLVVPAPTAPGLNNKPKAPDTNKFSKPLLMKKNHRSQLAWAAFALALAAGSLVAQDGDASARKPMLLAEALKARDEGNLQVAQEKFKAILAIDPKDMGANEGLTSVNAALAEASAAKQSADATSATKADAQPPVVTPAPVSALDEVATAHQNRFDEVSRAIVVAKAKVAAGDFKRAQEILDGANGAIAAIPTAAAQKLRDAIALAKQDLAVRRDAGSLSAPQDEVKRLVKDNAVALAKQDDAIAAAEKLLRKGTAESVDKAISDLDAADRALGAESLSNKDLKGRIKATKGSALARRALLAIEARDMNRATSLVADYAKLKGEEDPAVLRLQKELASKRDNPTFRNIDELSPGVRAKDDKVNELLVKGRARYLYGDYQGALDAYREVLQYQPNNSESKAYQIRIRQMLSDNSGQWNRGVTKGKLLELLDETWKLPEVFNRENTKSDLGNGNDPVTEKMKTIRLPEGFAARDEPLDRALTKLSGLSQTYDKDQKGVNIVPVTDGGESPTVNLQLRDVTVFQALDYLCKRVGYSFSVSPSGIVEVRKDAGDGLLDTQFFELTQAAVVKMTGQGLNTTAPGGAAANPFGGAGGAAGPAEGNPQENAIKSFLTRSGVPFEPPATLSFDGTRLIVTQSPKNLDRVKNIIRRYSDIKQVHIEAKFIEVEQKALNELGVNWSMTPTVEGNGGVTAGTNLRSINRVFAQNNTQPKNLTINSQITDTGGITTNNTQIFPNVSPTFPGGMNLGNLANTYSGTVNILSRETLALTIRAIEESAGSDLMSSPSLTVLDGKTAVIKVAQLLRYPQAYGDIQSNVGQGGGGGNGGVLGAAQTSVAITAGTPQDFTVQEVGVTLEVTPTVAADDSIALNLKPKVTEFEGFVEYGGTSVALTGGVTVTVPSGFFQPIFSTREVTTDVTVFDGATVVIGGLTREEVKTIDDKVPVLGSLPLIGAAFRSTGKSVSKRSLMVFVTANLVSPGGATLRSSHPGMRAGATFSNPTIISPAGAVYREPIEAASPTEPAPAPVATEPAK